MAQKKSIETIFRRSNDRLSQILRGEYRSGVVVSPMGKNHFVGRVDSSTPKSKGPHRKDAGAAAVTGAG